MKNAHPFFLNKSDSLINTLRHFGTVVPTVSGNLFISPPYWFEPDHESQLTAYPSIESLPNWLFDVLKQYVNTPAPLPIVENHFNNITQADHDNLADIAWYIEGALSIAKSHGIDYTFCDEHVSSLNKFLTAFKEYTQANK